MMKRTLTFALLPLLIGLVVACDDEENTDPTPSAPTLTPEPEGAPTDTADGRLSCLGSNTQAASSSTNLQLNAWARTWADPDNDGGLQPAARLEAFDETGLSLGISFSDEASGRATLSIPTRTGSFSGTLLATADGYLDWYWWSSRAYTPPSSDTPPAGWAWLITAEELEAEATEAGIELQDRTGMLVGAVHDCDGFGVANAVIRWSGSTDDVTYLDDPSYQNSDSGIGEDHFTALQGATFTSTGGRFAIPNVSPGAVTVEAFGRTERGGPLVLLSVADVDVSRNAVTAVDLQPREGVNR